MNPVDGKPDGRRMSSGRRQNQWMQQLAEEITRPERLWTERTACAGGCSSSRAGAHAGGPKKRISRMVIRLCQGLTQGCNNDRIHQSGARVGWPGKSTSQSKFRQSQRSARPFYAFQGPWPSTLLGQQANGVIQPVAGQHKRSTKAVLVIVASANLV